MTAPRTRLRWNFPEVWRTLLAVGLTVGFLAAAAAIYGGPA